MHEIEIPQQPDKGKPPVAAARKRRPPSPPARRDLRKALPETLVSINEIVAPDGPAPWRRSRFLEAVKAGDAPQPVLRGRRCTRWRWSDICEWLDQLAGRGEA